MNCDHIIGEWQGVDEGGVMHLSNWDTGNDYDVERFKFCPCCGKNISKLKPKKEKREKVKHDARTQAFIDQSERLGLELMMSLARKPSLLSSLKKMDVSKIETVTFERSISVSSDPSRSAEPQSPE